MLTLLRNILDRLLHSLSFKLSFSAGLIIFLAVGAGAYLDICRQRQQLEARFKEEAAGFVETVRRATYWSMLRNQRESLHRIINDVARQPGVLRIRVFNKEGTIMFSSQAEEIGREVDKKAEACYGCHARDVPLSRLPSGERTRIFRRKGERILGTIQPIYNEPACYTPACHAHPPDQQVLGVLDVDLSLARMDRQLRDQLWRTLGFALLLFLGVSTFIGLAIILTVNRSVNRLVKEVDKVAEGRPEMVEQFRAPDELDKVARAFHRMAERVHRRERAQDRRYRRLIRNSTDAVVLLERRGRLVMANPEAAAILGRSEQELEGLDARELVLPEDMALLRQALRQALAQEGPTDMVAFRIRRADGQIRVLEGRFRRLDEEEGFQGLLGNLRDITQRRSLEAELERHRAFERQLIRQALNAILATDAEGVIRVFNDSAEELFQMRAEEVIGRLHYSRLFPRAQVRLLARSLFTRPRPGASLVRPAVIKCSDGKRLPVMLSARTLFIRGEFSGVMCFLQNLRESKQLKAQLIKNARLAAVGQTAAGLAHCMKNLVHGLGTATYLVDQGLAEADLELAKQGWSMIKRNLEQLGGLTQDLLSYARDRRPQYQPFNLNQLLQECVQLVAGRAQELGVRVEVEADPTCGRVVLDPMGIRRVVLNLLSNSLDALQEHPPRDREPRVVLSDGRDGFGQVWVAVSDNGPGVPSQVRRHLFSGVFTTKGSKGTGLGLLVSQKIVQEHGGAIECFSPPGGGARFTFIVPDLGESEGAEPTASAGGD